MTPKLHKFFVSGIDSTYQWPDESGIRMQYRM
jgi:hypothetical protein